jgi:hypothetical protein
MYWIGFSLSVVAFGAIVLFVFPIIARWFFKKYSDSVSQYIFVLALLFLSAFLAQLIGIEGIIGAFLAGIALNKLIPSTSALMNRIDFVGNAIFIPIFLIGVGMLVDIKAIFSGYTTLLIALLMSVVATASKFLAAYATQKTFKLTVENRNMIFGLSNAQAAATLAVVIVSHGLGIFGDSILDATIIMILTTCLISSFVTEKAARKIVKSEKLKINQRQSSRILIPVSNPNTIERLINLATMMRSTKSHKPIYALYVSDKQSDSSVQQEISKSLLEKATFVAAANDTAVRGINLKDNSIANGIIHTIKQHSITDVVLGFSTANFASALFRMDSEALLKGTSQTIFYSRVLQPINTIKRILVVVAPNAEYEVGFSRWLYRITNLYKQIGAKLVFYADNSTIEKIRFLNNDKRNQYEIQCIEFNKWTDFLILAKEIQEDDLFVTVTARKGSISYNPLMERLPNIFSNYFRDKNILLIYPEQYQSNDEQTLFLSGSPTT